MGYIALACDDRLNSHNKMLKEQLVEDLQDDLNESHFNDLFLRVSQPQDLMKGQIKLEIQ